MNSQNNESPFGPIIFRYTRAQALADGFQIDVSETAREAGIKFPVFLTRTVWEKYVSVPPDVSGQDESGRLWDILWMLRFAILRSRPGCDRVPVALYVRNDNRKPRLVKLFAQCGPLDIDEPFRVQPVEPMTKNFHARFLSSWICSPAGSRKQMPTPPR
ncbi:MAG: hypothetical protein IAF94_03660, partial [Pirellulaceae bacterium]|nr:hypothetical protein [Pirellulaceae bacterium]